MMNSEVASPVKRDRFSELAEDAFSFLGSFMRECSDGRVLVVHHADADGCIAAVYVRQVFRKTHPSAQIEVVPFANHEFTFRKLLRLSAASERKLVVSLDLPVHQEPDIVRRICSSGSRMIIYDHHVQGNSVGIPGFVLELNPLNVGMASHPACYFGYTLFRLFFPSESHRLWLLGAGLIADHALQDYPEVVSRLARSGGDLLAGYKAAEPASAYGTALGRIASRINSGFRYDPGNAAGASLRAVEEAFEADNPLAFFSDGLPTFRRLAELQRLIDLDVKREIQVLKRCDLECSDPPLLFYVSTSRHFIAGVLASIAASENPGVIVAVCSAQEDVFQCEIRRGAQVRIDLTDILKRQRNYFRCISSGGHPAAAGAMIARGEIEGFQLSLLRALREAREGGS